jgi:hypothetical protein
MAGRHVLAVRLLTFNHLCARLKLKNSVLVGAFFIGGDMPNEEEKFIGAPKADDEPNIPAETVREKTRPVTATPTLQRRNGRKPATGHGILSRHPRQALINAGSDSQELARIERSLREAVQPDGIIGELLFDRMLACL